MATIIIPSRMDSVRLPGKPLMLIRGVPMIERVYESARAANVGPVLVAVGKGMYSLKMPTMFTGHNRCGTDRVAEAAMNLGLKDTDIVINVQGDMPFVHPLIIRQLAMEMEKNPLCSIMTVVQRRKGSPEPGFVSVAVDRQRDALYFSRSPIPHGCKSYLRHIGMYGFRMDALRAVRRMTTSYLEDVEQLEQLRWLENGWSIRVVPTEYDPGPEINTPEDLEMVNQDG